MESTETLTEGQPDREREVLVVGLARVIREVRAAYPELFQEAVRTILRLPPEVGGPREKPRED